ncbi:CaiB/BaiF CoA-transferase family protein [Sulfitobacter sp. W074]|uniref:CaiB/BaiF CoA transferase family protein n=1 Tax=Sulfitobacter sp. W074 TaxID=2867026 RepID=UPI0021A600C4|nr:CoA transferase [Sulfitobacter sp. W074]UWR38459.1 CoA transferase [Sulfitobacter sp. W074]
MTQTNAQPPLTGITVIDLSRLVSGNIVTHILADFGAEVIKVEKPGRGDDLRNWKVEGVSTFWKTYCRNKKSIALDFRHPDGMAVLKRLINGADVLVENFRPGTLEKMGLAPDSLLENNPGLIVVRISGWGQTGIWRDRPGFGSLIEAMSGFAAMNGFEDRPPVLPPLALADMIAGQSGATAVLMALRARDRDGTGQVVDLSLFEPMFAALGPQIANLRLSGREPGRMGSLSELSAPRNIYETSDGGFVALSASTQAMAERVFRAIGRPELVDDPRFRTNSDRVRNLNDCDQIVADFIRTRTRSDIMDLFSTAEVTIGIVATYKDLDGHSYITSRGVIEEVPDPGSTDFPMHAVSPRMSRTPGAITHIGPSLGADGPDLLKDFGCSADDIARLVQDGILALPTDLEEEV